MTAAARRPFMWTVRVLFARALIAFLDWNRERGTR